MGRLTLLLFLALHRQDFKLNQGLCYKKAPYPFLKAGMMKILCIFAIIWLQASLHLCERIDMKDCIPGPTPTYVNCTYGNITVQHGRIEGTPPPTCQGLYCWNGPVTPIGCPLPKPVQNHRYTDVPHRGSWPLCCYYQRECDPWKR
ncbi:uncharacterized protein LOC119399672 isoform X2 [Rhipicephalus sanguineus]|uniref:uncharacterized protein LOC119399672 isoform X2 n=1 Tax=Rhipicephalus sanguineus TaxID=34632 RepID=UPI001895EA22|nr:uncharacterized protein LOC119399672 isoform X2 [Rhipicephalus sanguineus]